MFDKHKIVWRLEPIHISLFKCNVTDYCLYAKYENEEVSTYLTFKCARDEYSLRLYVKALITALKQRLNYYE